MAGCLDDGKAAGARADPSKHMEEGKGGGRLERPSHWTLVSILRTSRAGSRSDVLSSEMALDPCGNWLVVTREARDLLCPRADEQEDSGAGEEGDKEMFSRCPRRIQGLAGSGALGAGGGWGGDRPQDGVRLSPTEGNGEGRWHRRFADSVTGSVEVLLSFPIFGRFYVTFRTSERDALGGSVG